MKRMQSKIGETYDAFMVIRDSLPINTVSDLDLEDMMTVVQKNLREMLGAMDDLKEVETWTRRLRKTLDE